MKKMKITKEFLEKVLKLRNVRECGDDFMASCPFENILHADGEDSHPSFGIHKEEGIWHCFACGKEGNLVSLVSQVLSKSYEDAQKVINSYFYKGMNIDKIISKTENLIKEFYNGNNDNKYLDKISLPDEYTNILPEKVLNFFESRGIKLEVLKKFEIGFCRDGIYKNRIIFPIFLGGKQVSFVSRKISDNENEMKYLNPKNFQKYVYNLCYNMDKAFLVEGPLDVLKLYSLGLKNVCALFGDDITYFQIRLLITHGVKKVCLMLDGDDAGKNAIKRIISKIKQFFSVSIIYLSDGKDPCDIKNRKELMELLETEVGNES